MLLLSFSRSDRVVQTDLKCRLNRSVEKRLMVLWRTGSFEKENFIEVSSKSFSGALKDRVVRKNKILSKCRLNLSVKQGQVGFDWRTGSFKDGSNWHLNLSIIVAGWGYLNDRVVRNQSKWHLNRSELDRKGLTDRQGRSNSLSCRLKIFQYAGTELMWLNCRLIFD